MPIIIKMNEETYEEIKAVLKGLDWCTTFDKGGYPQCAYCGAYSLDGREEEHKDDCPEKRRLDLLAKLG